MTITTHTAIGAAIGFQVGNPVLGFILGFASHLLVDMIPHGDSNLSDTLRIKKKKTIPIAYGTIDALVAIYLMLIIFNVKATPTSTVALSAAIGGSIAPDFLVGIYEITKTKYLRWFYKMHFFFHDFFITRYRDIKLPYALAYQAGFVALVLNVI